MVIGVKKNVKIIFFKKITNISNYIVRKFTIQRLRSWLLVKSFKKKFMMSPLHWEIFTDYCGKHIIMVLR